MNRLSQLFSHNKFYKAECSLILNQLFEKGKTIVSIHLRRGDADAKGPYFYAPTLWYIEWLESIWATLERPVLFIASEDPGSVVADFQNYNPYTLSDFYTGSDKHSYYFDFYILQNSNYLAISNSTFSFAASMLNHKCNIFYRPCRHSGRLVLFNPWNSDPLLDNIYEPYVKLAARVKELFQTINKNSVSALNQIRNVRKQMINIWLSTSEYELEPLFHSKFGTAYRAFLNSPLKTKQMDLQEHHLKQELMDNVNLGMEKAWFMQYLLSAMLLCEPVDFSFNNDLLLFPDWFLSDYINYLKLPLAIR